MKELTLKNGTRIEADKVEDDSILLKINGTAIEMSLDVAACVSALLAAEDKFISKKRMYLTQMLAIQSRPELGEAIKNILPEGLLEEYKVELWGKHEDSFKCLDELKTSLDMCKHIEIEDISSQVLYDAKTEEQKIECKKIAYKSLKSKLNDLGKMGLTYSEVSIPILAEPGIVFIFRCVR